MVIKAINFHIFPPTPPPLYKPLFHFIFNSQIILSFSENLISSLATFPQVQPWRRREELTLSGCGCSRAPLILPPAPLPLLPAPLLLSSAPLLLSPGLPAAADPAVAGSVAAAAGAGPSVPAAHPHSDAVSPAPAARDAEGSSSMAPTQRRYHTRVGPTPPAPSHPKPAWRAPPAKRARTSGPRESSTSRSRAPPSPLYQGIAGAPDLSPGSIIR